MPSPSSVTQSTVALEYASLRNKDHCPLGMYIVPAAQSLLSWDAVFFVHRGASSIFRALISVNRARKVRTLRWRHSQVSYQLPMGLSRTSTCHPVRHRYIPPSDRTRWDHEHGTPLPTLEVRRRHPTLVRLTCGPDLKSIPCFTSLLSSRSRSQRTA